MIRYRRSRVDQNHRAIAEGLESLCCSTLSLAPLGDDACDLLVGARGLNVLLEIKRPGLRDHAPANERERKRIERQREWAAGWRGLKPHEVYSLEEAIAAVNADLVASGRSPLT